MHPTTAAGQPLRGNVGRMALHCHPRRVDRISSIKSQTIHQGVPTWDIEAGLKQMLSKRPRFCRSGRGPGLHHLHTVRPTGPVSRGSGAGRIANSEPAEIERHAGQVPPVTRQSFVQQVTQTGPRRLVVSAENCYQSDQFSDVLVRLRDSLRM